MSESIVAIALSGMIFAFNAAVCARMFFEFGRVDYIVAAAVMAIFPAVRFSLCGHRLRV